MLKEEDKSINFTLNGIDQTGKEISFSLTNHLNTGQNIVLYFYPKDDTPGCTQEACDFRDNLNRLGTKALVIGVSPDGIASHKKFKEKYSINFTLLSDPEHKVLEEYEAWGEKKMYGKIYQGVIRSTYLISQEGIIKKIWKNVKVKGHVDEVLSQIEKLQQ